MRTNCVLISRAWSCTRCRRPSTSRRMRSYSVLSRSNSARVGGLPRILAIYGYCPPLGVAVQGSFRWPPRQSVVEDRVEGGKVGPANPTSSAASGCTVGDRLAVSDLRVLGRSELQNHVANGVGVRM